jgi:hypothetical protein
MSGMPNARRARARGAILALLLVVVATLAGLELGARAFWKLELGVPMSRPSRLLWGFYPELWDVEWKGRDLAPLQPVRVLLLGGSALHPSWGSVEQGLRERLTTRLHRPVVTFNMAAIGHTTRDSLLKYEALAGRHFDLVFVYHGINDARANNVPPEGFAADYSHYAWYETVNALARHRDGLPLVLPATLGYLATRIKERSGLVAYVGMDQPRPEWTAYGGDIKTAGPFEANVEAIVALAQARGEHVLLATFATYVPDDYTKAAFDRHALDYTLHLSPIEMWGTRENVMAAVGRHNEIVRAVAARHPDVAFADAAAAMPRGAAYFNDVCHLTAAGSAKLVDALLEPAVAALTPRGP